MYKYIVLMTLCCACVVPRGMCQNDEGDPCTSDAGSGTCKKEHDCLELKENLKMGKKPKICGFVGNTAVVCCVPEKTDDYDYSEEEIPEVECDPVPANGTTAKKTGQKAWDKCIDYLKYVYPCEALETLTLRVEKVRMYQCNHEVTGLVVGGNDTLDKEFPHMALLGYGRSQSTARWLCGGTVISEHYVMTAGHCTVEREDTVTFIRVGLTKMSEPIEQSNLYKVAEIIKHPEYKAPSYYNDIALIKTTTKIQFDTRVYPACLHTGKAVNDDKMVATGWGLLHHGSSISDTLQKVTLEKFTAEECSGIIGKTRKHRQGLLPASQLCAGHHTKDRDTCQGDSGGPLQIYNLDVSCMYTIMGITSFGQGCGNAGIPGVYTRVSYFLTWIESIVWP